ncbi:MAG: hypothetical protein ACQET8_05115 [Bacillota bacterium]
MRKIILTLTIALLVLVGCSKDSNGEMRGKKPPTAFAVIGNEKHVMKLGSYCWKSNFSSICVDSAGPIELVSNEKPIQVRSGAEISFAMKGDSKPNEYHLSQFHEENERKIDVRTNTFIAPDTLGTYVYGYSVWWMSEEKENVSDGDALYAFAIEVVE